MNQSPCCPLLQYENPAPIIGPIRNPRLKATPIKAMPLPRVAEVDTSVTIEADNDTFPFDIPPIFDSVIYILNINRFYSISSIWID